MNVTTANNRLRLRLLSVLVFGLILRGGPAAAQTADNLLVVINDASPTSVQIGEYYVQKRNVASDHVVHIRTITADTIQRSTYELTIETPIATTLATHNLQDEVLYIVLTKGVPLRVAGTGGLQGTAASVDSELTLLYRKLLSVRSPIVGRIANPYFLGDRDRKEAKPFTRIEADIYLVTRLDGFTAEDVLKLIDRGLAPSRTGKIVLDQKATLLDAGGDRWLQQAADRLDSANAGDRVLLETTAAVASTKEPVLGYYSWGSNDRSNQLRHFGLSFVPGAIAAMFVSTDGRTFAEPPADWVPSNPDGRGPLFGGGFQSLAGDLIRDGITGVAAHVDEPFLDATIRPQILFPAYLSGLNLAESFYLAMPFLSWQTVVIGDPLCAPFRTQPLSPDQLSKGIDSDTELPAIFAGRRLALLARKSSVPAALKLVLKVDSQLARGITDNAEALLLQASTLDPGLTLANQRLAALYLARGDFDKSADRLRSVVKADPQDALALNNLAYLLAVNQHVPKEALPFAERAFALSPASSTADTLAWTHHLLGEDHLAVPFLEKALAPPVNEATILVHAAIIHAALRDLLRAQRELTAAEKLDPHVAESEDVKTLHSRLKSAENTTSTAPAPPPQ